MRIGTKVFIPGIFCLVTAGSFADCPVVEGTKLTRVSLSLESHGKEHPQANQFNPPYTLICEYDNSSKNWSFKPRKSRDRSALITLAGQNWERMAGNVLTCDVNKNFPFDIPDPQDCGFRMGPPK